MTPWPLSPPAPSRLNAWPAGAGTIHLRWGDNAPNETAYEIQYKLSSDSTWTTLPQEGGDVNEINLADLVSGSDYDFRVRALNSTGSSAWSTTAKATTPVNDSLSYSDWVGSFDWLGKDSSMEGDADLDGLKNLPEYVLNSNPLVPTPADSVMPFTLPLSGTPQLSFSLDNRRTSAIILAQSSSDLESWDTDETYIPDGTMGTISIDYIAPRAASPGDPVFLRLNFVESP